MTFPTVSAAPNASRLNARSTKPVENNTQSKICNNVSSVKNSEDGKSNQKFSNSVVFVNTMNVVNDPISDGYEPSAPLKEGGGIFMNNISDAFILSNELLVRQPSENPYYPSTPELKHS